MKTRYEKPTLTQVGKANDVVLGICSHGDDMDGHLLMEAPCPADIMDPLDPETDL